MNSIDKNIFRCRDQLNHIRKLKRSIKNEEIVCMNSFEELMQIKYKEIWYIRCLYSNNEYINKGIFSSREIAEKIADISKDCDSRINYTIESRDSDEISFYQWELLDSNPF